VGGECIKRCKREKHILFASEKKGIYRTMIYIHEEKRSIMHCSGRKICFCIQLKYDTPFKKKLRGKSFLCDAIVSHMLEKVLNCYPKKKSFSSPLFSAFCKNRYHILVCRPFVRPFVRPSVRSSVTAITRER
jgi:hypothetical protein